MYPMTPLQGNDCQCAACGATFASLATFDLHQLWSADGDGETLTCLDAAGLGLVAGPVWASESDIARGLRLETVRQNRRSQTPENGHL